MIEFINMLRINFQDITKMIMFNFFKTGNPVYDTIISTFLISIFGIVLNYICEYKILYQINLDDIKYYFYKKNMIIIQGNNSSITSTWTITSTVVSVYSNRFKAIWSYIISNIDTNNTINIIKESHSNVQSSEIGGERKKNSDIFVVNQKNHFNIDDNIFVKVEITQQTKQDEKNQTNIKQEDIIIYIYSYKYSVGYLKKYLDNITEKYLETVKNNRLNKRFIYFLDNAIPKEHESNVDYWRENLFESPRTFSNIFFDGKNQLINKIDFFLNNREWYFEKGIPYSLGIGLHGPPGTGKTSFIKALANYTNRHIIVISLKLIKTKSQLEKHFFENTYNNNNETNTITFDKKIIVFEDIDCIGDIILERNNKKTDESNNNIQINSLIQTICEIKNPIKNDNADQAITLDDILNLWDGIRETPGRILIISSNHYDKLDSALIRPGRIDITHELSNASHNTIAEIYFHLFGNEIDKTHFLNIKDKFYSPAELINIYVTHKTENEFIERLKMNKKI